MVGWLTVKDKTCVTHGSHVDQDSTSFQNAHAPRSSTYTAHDTHGTVTQQYIFWKTDKFKIWRALNCAKNRE